MNSYALNLDSIFTVDDVNFELICRNNPEIKFERNTKGDLIIMAPTGGEIGRINFELMGYFAIWNHQKQLGVGFDSSTCFRLPSKALRYPDFSWIKNERWNSLTPEEQAKFSPIAPDFVLELMSPSDSLKDTREKMLEYMDNGVQLGWLINRKNKQVEIYRQGKEVEILDNPKTLMGEDILPKFIINIEWILQ
jgi:Uma2 family endonuclease